MAKPRYTFSEIEPHVHEIRFSDVRKGWEQWVFLSADEHWDNPKCNLDLLKKHHEQAKERNAICLKFGDLFCAMQGKYDKRASKNDLRPEHQRSDYLDGLVETAAAWFEPYADNLLVCGYGNHETAIRNHHETDLLTRFTERLRAKGKPTRTGGYDGWIRLSFTIQGTKRCSLWIYYNHGWGGGGPVTKGAIDFNRIAARVDGADIVCSGHVHERMHVANVVVAINDAARPYRKQVDFIRCSTYKDEYGTGGKSWHIEKGRGPRPLGGYWMRLFFDKGRIGREFTEAN